MKARYVRCSTDAQNPARQLQKSHPDELLFIDFISGAVSLDKRSEGLKMLQAIESGQVDFLTIESIDRLGRSTTDVINRLQYFQDKGVTVRV
ncbi:MAG: transposase, partial [Flavobacterium psychrophilum]